MKRDIQGKNLKNKQQGRSWWSSGYDFPFQSKGMQIWSLVGELRSPMPREPENQNIKQKKYCNKFNKDFLNGPHKKDL